MLIYRVEHKDTKKGPYFSDTYWYNPIHYTNSHPPPANDGITCKISYFNCGFESLTKLYNWFSFDDRKQLHYEGFIIAIYQVKKCIFGNKQVVFRNVYNNAERIRVMPIIII